MTSTIERRNQLQKFNCAGAKEALLAKIQRMQDQVDGSSPEPMDSEALKELRAALRRAAMKAMNMRVRRRWHNDQEN